MLALAKVVERVVVVGKSSSALLRECFTSLMEASIRWKELQEEEEAGGEEETEDDDEIEDDDDDDDDEV